MAFRENCGLNFVCWFNVSVIIIVILLGDNDNKRVVRVGKFMYFVVVFVNVNSSEDNVFDVVLEVCGLMMVGRF